MTQSSIFLPSLALSLFLVDFCSLIFYGCIHFLIIICRATSSISNAMHYALL